MNPIIGGTIILFAVLGGWWGWRRGARFLYRRSPYNERPSEVAAEDYERRLIAFGKRQRFLSTVGFTLAGAGVACVLLVVAALSS